MSVREVRKDESRQKADGDGDRAFDDEEPTEPKSAASFRAKEHNEDRPSPSYETKLAVHTVENSLESGLDVSERRGDERHEQDRLTAALWEEMDRSDLRSQQRSCKAELT